jgi:hypothetical protein
MIIAVSFSHCNFRHLRELWRAFEAFNPPEKTIGTTIKDREDWDGLVLVLDWERKRILREAAIPLACGFVRVDDSILVNAYNRIVKLTLDLERIGEVEHHLFNGLHSLSVCPNGFLATSTGIDLLLYLDGSLQVEGHWSPTQHGFDTTPFGTKRRVDLKADHRHQYYPTLHQATHMNSATYYARNQSIFVSLFHQNLVLELCANGDIKRTVIQDLKAPHSIYFVDDDTFLVSDTARGRFLLVDVGGDIKKAYSGNCDWLQDTIVLPNGNFLCADANHYRIVEIHKETGGELSFFRFSEDWQIYQLAVLEP